MNVSMFDENEHDDPSLNPAPKTRKLRDVCPTCGQPIAGDTIPYQTIMKLWNEMLAPPLPSVLKMTSARKKAVRARWNSGDLPSLEKWKEAFGHIRRSDKLMGRCKPAADSPFANWRCTFDWAIKETSLVKLFEGKYDNT